MKTRINKTGWIIVDRNRGRVWKQVYHAKEEAEAELKSQIAMAQKTHPTYTGSEWKLEASEYTVTEDVDEDAFKDFKGKTT